MTYLWNLLIALDQLANALLAPALNAVLRPTAARFGHPDETLSSVLGKNVEAKRDIRTSRLHERIQQRKSDQE